MRVRPQVSMLALVALCGCYVTDAEESPVPAEGLAAIVPAAAAGAPEPTLLAGDEGGADDQSATPTPLAQPSGKPMSREAASRFLVQASFGGAPEDIASLQEGGAEAYILGQAALPVREMTPRVLATPDAKRPVITDLFWNYAIEGEDQLRQRVTYALSQIIVVSSDHEEFYGHPEAFTEYADALQRHALGNYTDLVREVSVLPAMGSYLSSAGNRRHDPKTGAQPDENFAREVMQLFTIGLVELERDGTPTGRPTYTNEDIKGLAKVFTGLSWAGTDFRWPNLDEADKTAAMASFPDYHEPGPKTFLGATVDAGADPRAAVDAALGHLLAHPNLAPFVTKQLIQRLVTSNPSPAYVERVASAFEAGSYRMPSGRTVGEGRRGDMLATVSAILMDREARAEEAAEAPGFGRVREPILRFAHFARAFRDDEGAPRTGTPRDVGTLRWSDRKEVLSQKPFAPPSVFGFTRPGYVAPGSWSAEADMVAPNLATAGGSSALGFIEFMKTAAEGKIWAGEFFAPDYDEALLPLADRPDALVDELDAVLTYGSMAQATRERIVRALNAVRLDAGGDTDEAVERQKRHRVELGVFMATTAPAYAVQR